MRVVAEVAVHGQRAVRVVRERDVRGARLRDGVAVVEVQLAARRAVPAHGDEKHKVLRAEAGGRVGARDAHGHDGAAAHVQRDVGEGLVGEGDVGAGAAELGVGPQVEEDVVGEVGGDRGAVFVRDGADEYGRAEEVLQVDAEGVGVGRVEVEERAEQGRAVDRLPPEGGVDVVEELVADTDGLAGRDGDGGGPAVELLRRGVVGGVVAVEWGKGAQHGPARTELLRRVGRVAAHVRPDHRHLVDGRHAQQRRDREPVMQPVGEVVTEPLAYFGARAGEGAACNDDGPPGRAAGQHCVAAVGRHHGPEEVVRVIHDEAVVVDHVDGDGVVGEAAGRAVAFEVADRVGRNQEVAAG